MPGYEENAGQHDRYVECFVSRNPPTGVIPGGVLTGLAASALLSTNLTRP